MHASADKVLAALRGRATDTAPIPLGDGDVTAVALQLGDERVLALAFDYGARQGSIGIQEADQLVRAFQFARSERLPITLLLETSGIRVTDGTAGIASLRRVLREAEDARLDGLPMLGVVLRCAFGGASILAALCDRRMIHRGLAVRHERAAADRCNRGHGELRCHRPGGGPHAFWVAPPGLGWTGSSSSTPMPTR